MSDAKETEASDAPIVTRERLYNMTLAEVQADLNARVGKPNVAEVQGHAAGTLKVKSVAADGGTERWRVFLTWEPIEAIAHGVFQ